MIEFLNNLFNIEKLSFKTIIVLCLSTIFILIAPYILPSNIITIFHLEKILDKMGMYISIFAIVTSVYSLVCVVIYFNKKINSTKEYEYQYNKIFSKMAELLFLDSWIIFQEFAPKGMVIKQFVSNQNEFNSYILSIIWPKRFIKLKRLVLNYTQAYNDFVNTIKEQARLVNDGQYDYSEMINDKEWWQKMLYKLCYMTYILNKLVNYTDKVFKEVGIIDKLRRNFTLGDNIEMPNGKSMKIVFVPLKMKKYRISKNGISSLMKAVSYEERQ